MLSELFKYVGLKIKENNPWVNTFSVNCISIPTSEGNRVVNFEGEEKFDFSFDDTKGCGFYIKTNPRFNYSNGRRINSCDTQYQQNIDFTLVFFAINNDKNLSPLKLESAFTNNLRVLNFGAYTGEERAIRINILNTNANFVDVFKSEINLDYQSGANLIAISINARLIYDIISETCEETCLEDLVITDFSEEGGYTEMCDYTPSDHGYVIIRNSAGQEIDRVDCGGEYVCAGGGSASVVVQNSDASYSVTTSTNLTLPNTQYDIYVNSVFNQTVNLVTLKNETLNINP